MTVTDADGCVAESCADYENFPQDTFCFAFIEILPSQNGVELLAYSFGLPPYTYEWSTGETSETISPDTGGVYCVSITDALGCVAESCIDVDDTQCHLYMYVGFDGSIQADLFGIGPYSYEWSTGDSSEIIFGLPGETYCVTVTDVTGCEASECVTLHPIQDTICFVDVFAGITASGVTGVEAFAFGIPPFQYEWNTGETTQTINPQDQGTYCVTVTDAVGCVAEGVQNFLKF